MRTILTTLIVAALATFHAQATDLESQLPGYWQPDMEKTLALAKKANREIDPMTQVMMGKMVFEFQKDKMIVHVPPGMKSDATPVALAVKGMDQAATPLTLSVGGKEMQVRFDNAQMALNDPKTGWTIFNRMSKENFAKRQAGGAKIKVEGGGKAPASGKLQDVSAQPIPDTPAAGKVHGREFKVEEATLEDDCLKLRQGEGFATHLEEFAIDFRGTIGGSFAGETFTVKPDQKAEIDITLAYSGERKGSIKTRTYMRDYTMKLEFGTAKDGKLPGKIHLRLPDEAGSFVVGTFEAEIK